MHSRAVSILPAPWNSSHGEELLTQAGSWCGSTSSPRSLPNGRSQESHPSKHGHAVQHNVSLDHAHSIDLPFVQHPGTKTLAETCFAAQRLLCSRRATESPPQTGDEVIVMSIVFETSAPRGTTIRQLLARLSCDTPLPDYPRLKSLPRNASTTCSLCHRKPYCRTPEAPPQAGLAAVCGYRRKRPADASTSWCAVRYLRRRCTTRTCRPHCSACGRAADERASGEPSYPKGKCLFEMLAKAVLVRPQIGSTATHVFLACMS
jgi:hypothetical protein